MSFLFIDVGCFGGEGKISGTRRHAVSEVLILIVQSRIVRLIAVSVGEKPQGIQQSVVSVHVGWFDGSARGLDIRGEAESGVALVLRSLEEW